MPRTINNSIKQSKKKLKFFQREQSFKFLQKFNFLKLSYSVLLFHVGILLLFMTSGISANAKIIYQWGNDSETLKKEWSGNIKIKKLEHAPGNGICGIVEDSIMITSKNFFPVKPGTNYTLRGVFKSLGKVPSKFYYGLIPYDKNKRKILYHNTSVIQNTGTKLAVTCQKGDKSIIIKLNENWKVGGCVAFNAKKDFSDLPNYEIKRPVKKIIPRNGNLELQLGSTVNKIYPAGTGIREHRNGGGYLYSTACGKVIPKNWQKYIGNIMAAKPEQTSIHYFRPGTAFVKIMILPNYGKKQDEKMAFTNLELKIADPPSKPFYAMKKEEKTATFTLQNSSSKAYLWIMAHAWDIRELEHGGAPLQIKVNGIILDKNRSVLQDNYYSCPYSRRKSQKLPKYNNKSLSWLFKFDNDFTMNNGCGDKGVYTTKNLNFWYAFNLDGIAKKGKNEITLTECLNSSRWKTCFYGGFLINELGFFSLDKIKEKIEEYNSVISGDASKKQSLILEEPQLPKGKIPEIKVKDGYIIKDAKPFLQLLVQTCSNVESGPRNMLYLNWGNDLQLYKFMVQEAAKGKNYLTPKWNEQKIKTLMPKFEANLVYKQNFLCDWRYVSFNLDASFVPPTLAARIPDLYAIDSRGKICHAGHDVANSRFPNFGSSKYKEYIREIITLIGKELNGHPGAFANSAHEELRWRCYSYYLPPQDKTSIKKYRKMLERQYKDIDNLNKEWGTKHKTFLDITPPRTREQSANFINFQIFRARILQDYSKFLYTSLKKAFPNNPVTGERSGDQWTSNGWQAGESWFLNSEWADIRTIGYGGTALARAAQRYYGSSGKKFTLQNDICFSCQYKYINKPFRPFWTPSVTHDQYGLKIAPGSFFGRIIHDMFEGVRCSFYYSYDNDRHHLIHNQGRYSAMKRVANFNGWEIDLAKLKGLPEILVPEQSRAVTRANGLCYKIVPLLLPAETDKGKAALLYTRRSSLIGWTFDNNLKGREGGHIPRCEWQYLHKLLEHLHVPFEVMTEDTFIKELGDYKVLIAGYWATMGSKDMADKIKDFVSQGNTVVFYPDAFCYNWNTTENLECSPGYGLDKLFCAKIKRRISRKPVKIKLTNDIGYLKKGTIFQARGLVTPLEKLQGGKVIAELADTGEPVIISANYNKTYYIGFVPGISYSSERENGGKIRELFYEIIKNSKIKKPVEIEKTQNSYLVYTRILHGKDYWLLTFLNESDKKQTIKAYLNFLPKGNYEIIDVTGNGKPFLLSGNSRSGDLSGKGISVSLDPLFGKVIIVRKSGQAVRVDCPEYELAGIMKNYPVDIVLGYNTASSVRNLVDKLQKLLKNKGLQTKILNEETVRLEDKETNLSEGCFIFAKFHNRIIPTQNNLILIGNRENNRLIANLCQKSSYTYDKVLEDVDSSYPGKGKGIIQVSESVNKPYYCPTDKGRDAILIGGSDNEGTIKALENFITIIK